MAAPVAPKGARPGDSWEHVDEWGEWVATLQRSGAIALTDHAPSQAWIDAHPEPEPAPEPEPVPDPQAELLQSLGLEWEQVASELRGGNSQRAADHLERAAAIAFEASGGRPG